MSREVRRVPLDFNWPLTKVWQGYLRPDEFDEIPCTACKNGYSTHAQNLYDLWYGYLPFHPATTGSTPLRADTPAVRAFAERNIGNSPEYYGTGEAAIVREAQRLADLWNGMWSHHLTQDDVDALVEADRLWDLTRTWKDGDGWQKIDPPVTPTAEQVNEWSLRGFGHDSLNASVVVRARCEREGVPVECPQCEGHGSTEAHPGQREAAEKWEATEPPTGDGWQLWETVSEGSPISPVFAEGEDLAQWMSVNPCGFAGAVIDIDVARRWLQGSGWAPSMVLTVMGVTDGITALDQPVPMVVAEQCSYPQDHTSDVCGFESCPEPGRAKLVLEIRGQEDETPVIGALMLTPPIDEDYWAYRVRLSDKQAMVGFPKFRTIGIGFAVEEDWNTNLPYTCSAEEIYAHIEHNKGDDTISDEDCIAAIELIQDAIAGGAL